MDLLSGFFLGVSLTGMLVILTLYGLSADLESGEITHVNGTVYSCEVK